MQCQETYATGVKPAKTRRNHLSTTQQGNWLSGQTRPDLSCQLGLAQQYMPSPTVGQIPRANAWVCRADQFADLKLTFLSIPPEQLRFVIHTDCSSKDQDGTGRTQGGYIIGTTDPSMGAGHVAPWAHKLKQGCTSTLAGEAKALSSGLGHFGTDHVHVCHCFLPVLFGKTGTRRSSGSQQSVSTSARPCLIL